MRGGANNPDGVNQHARGEEVNDDNGNIDQQEAPERTSPTGNTRLYAARRLQRDRPDLYEKVRAGEMSANAAMIEAGFRKKKLPLDHLRHWWARAAIEDRLTFIRELGDEIDELRNEDEFDD